MLLNAINHKMPIYKDCTLREMLGVGATVLLTNSLVLSLITKTLFGFAWIGFGIALVSLVPLTKLLLGQLQRVKVGKPFGYYQQVLMKHCQNNALFSALFKVAYLTRLGKWSVRKFLS
jgi:conjugative transfer region protein (TIGR03750 family)